MDVLCPICTEPWDSYGLHIDTVPCEDCHGDGKVECETRISDDHNNGYTSLAVIGYDESSGITYEDCICQDESTWTPCATCTPYQNVVKPGRLPRPYVLIQKPERPRKGDIAWRGMQCRFTHKKARERYARYTAWMDARQHEETPCGDCDENGMVKHHRRKYDDEDREDCDHGSYSYLPSCDGCMEEIEARSYFDVNAVITDGAYYCLSCARENGMLVEEKDCTDCKGTGKVERGRDAMDPSEIRMFREGKGCPACDFGVGRRCFECRYGRIHGEECTACNGTGLEPLQKDNPRAIAAKLIMESCEHIDDMAAMTDDLITSDIADSMLGDDE